MAIISNEKVLAIGRGRSLSSHRHLASRGEPGRPSRCVRASNLVQDALFAKPMVREERAGTRGAHVSLLCGKGLLETAALFPHAQLVGRSYELARASFVSCSRRNAFFINGITA